MKKIKKYWWNGKQLQKQNHKFTVEPDTFVISKVNMKTSYSNLMKTAVEMLEGNDMFEVGKRKYDVRR